MGEPSVATMTPRATSATPTPTVVPAKRALASYMTAVAFLGMHIAALSVFFVEFSWLAVGMMVLFYTIRGFGLTAGYHRYFAHRAYKTSRFFQFCLGLMGAAALQRGPVWWAGHHRTHHKHSDEEGDPHSPIMKSIWWSHVGWVLSNQFNTVEWDLMKDFRKYPELKLLERFDLIPGILLAFLCLAIDGLSGMAWGFFFGTVVLYHTTFMVNSVCHLLGTRRYATKDMSRNNWFVAFFTLGEGWHNNHHHYPSSARQGFKWYEYDFSYRVLQLLSVVGIVWDLREPTPRAMAKKTIQAVS